MIAPMKENTEHIKKAIEAAQLEMKQVTEKLKDLQKYQQRLVQLTTFIEQGKLLIGEESEEVSSESIKDTLLKSTKPELLNLSIGDASEKPVYLKVVQIINEIGRPLNLTEMVEEFRKRQWKLSENNPREVLRNTLKTKPQIFMKTGQGEGGKVLYGLKK